MTVERTWFFCVWAEKDVNVLHEHGDGRGLDGCPGDAELQKVDRAVDDSDWKPEVVECRSLEYNILHSDFTCHKDSRRNKLGNGAPER